MRWRRSEWVSRSLRPAPPASSPRSNRGCAIGPLAQRVGSGAVVAGVAALLIGGRARARRTGDDREIVRSGLQRDQSEDLDDRLFSLSGNGRVDLWRVGWNVAVGASRHRVRRRKLPAPLARATSLDGAGPGRTQLLPGDARRARAGRAGARARPLRIPARPRRQEPAPAARSDRCGRSRRVPRSGGDRLGLGVPDSHARRARLRRGHRRRADRPGVGSSRPSGASGSSSRRSPSCRSSRSRPSAIVRKRRRPRRSPIATSSKAVGRSRRRAERLAPWSVEPVVLLGRAQAGAGDRGVGARDVQTRCFGRARVLAGVARAGGREQGCCNVRPHSGVRAR